MSVRITPFLEEANASELFAQRQHCPKSFGGLFDTNARMNCHRVYSLDGWIGVDNALPTTPFVIRDSFLVKLLTAETTVWF
jgi:hypothetical protein